MKQTVEEAAREAIYKHYNCNGEYPCGERNYCIYCNGHNTAFDCCECGADEFKEGFIAGAEWQAKQSPWTLVGDRSNPVPNDKFCLLLLEDGSVVEDDSNWEERRLMVVAWMLKPSFDEILEANKDVLQRLK